MASEILRLRNGIGAEIMLRRAHHQRQYRRQYRMAAPVQLTRSTFWRRATSLGL